LIVYSVSFSDPAGYFLATRVQMHNKDVIFTANAQSVEITKFRDDDHGGVAAAGGDATAGGAVMVYRLRPEDYRLATRRNRFRKQLASPDEQLARRNAMIACNLRCCAPGLR
jgi:hypothetical protein